MGADISKSQTDCTAAYEAFINSGKNLVASGKAKYIGGHPAITGESMGDLAVNSTGVFFKGKKQCSYFYLPEIKILRAAFKTGEEISRNAVFSRLLAINGFIFAYKKKSREKHMFLTIDYVENGAENVVLLETQTANEFVSAIAKVRQEANKLRQEANAKNETNPEQSKTVSELMIEINELRALGILTAEEFAAKKRELLSRI